MASTGQPARPTRFAAPRGTADLLPEDWPYWKYVRDTAERVCALFGYQRIETPIFEHAGVFLRTAGAGTDIVEKEVYLFEDRGGDRLALRPEGTATVMRAFIENGMASRPQPVRLYYVAPNFRYDRPQAGRYRQHTQFGAEAVGDGDPFVDAEMIHLLWSFLRELGLSGFTLKLNTIGDQNCRPAYVDALRAYYRPHLTETCADCRVRFEKNPLRLLDCKEDRCRPLIAAAPRLHDYLCDDCRAHFGALTAYLHVLAIDYVLDEHLVRGLDYYTRTVFECHPREEGAQSSIGSGGRYDGLVELLGGAPTPGIGFGAGFERLILNLKRQQVPVPAAPPPDVYVAHLVPEAAAVALTLAGSVRGVGRQVVLGGAGRSLKAQLRHANALGARYVAIIGPDELAAGVVTLRDLHGHGERRLALDSVARELA
ncbi:MAG TPA: histidine--tRNA ligase [Dehalococcoidia bacterium]|nr:histidine--tRNA ligase [Dehalococcoidia bacterium]